MEGTNELVKEVATGLVYCGRIIEITPIENADRIELATVICGHGGKWCGVVAKGDFEVDDGCTVFLQDALIPETTPYMEFMADRGYRVKMCRFRGAPSECVIVHNIWGANIGDDLTEEIGVTRYSRPLHGPMDGQTKGNFPHFINKTDEPNIQGAMWMLEELRGLPWYATTKLDGSSGTVYRRGDEFGVCSRHFEKKESEASVFWKVARKYDLANRLPDGFAVQFEVVGPKVQQNPLGLAEIDGFAFQVFDIYRDAYLSLAPLLELLNDIGMPMVPTVASGDSFLAGIEDLRKLAEGKYPNGAQREGIVIRPQTAMRCGRSGQQRLSFKVLNLLYKN